MVLDIPFVSEVPSAEGDVMLAEEIASTMEVKGVLLERILGNLQSAGFLEDPDHEVQARLCIDEALVNAVLHGNEGKPEKKVRVTLYQSPDAWTLRVEDQGKGFTPSAIPDPDDPNNLLLEHGRGVLIMKSYMDRVVYYRNGSGLLISRKRNSSPA